MPAGIDSNAGNATVMIAVLSAFGNLCSRIIAIMPVTVFVAIIRARLYCAIE